MFESLKTRAKYLTFNYASMLRHLLPLGKIWDYTQAGSGDYIQDTMLDSQPTVYQDVEFVAQPDVLQDVPGEARGEGSDTWFGNFFFVLAGEFAYIENRAFYLAQEAVPGLSIDLLEDHEYEAGIDHCSRSIAIPSIPERQLEVHAKLRGQHQKITNAYLVEYGAAFNLVITVEDGVFDNTDARCGVARCGDARCGSKGDYNGVIITAISGVGNFEQLQCAINELKQAHLIFTYVDER
jgi:uncharacterized protein YmfQ (DUF2313 family)